MLRRRRAAALLALCLAAAGPLEPLAHAQDDWSVQRDPFDPRLIARYKGLLERTPDDQAALKKLISLYRRHASVGKLIAEYQARRAKEPDKAVLALLLGHIHRIEGDPTAALAAYDDAARLAPNDPAAHLARGELLRAARRLADATAAWERALAATRDKKAKKKLLVALADLALESGDVDRARAFTRDLVAMDPDDLDARVGLAEGLVRHDRHAEALVEYQAALERVKGDPARRLDLQARIGKEYEVLGDDNKAIFTYENTISAAGKGHFLRRELTERIIEIHRRRGDVRPLIAKYESRWPASARGHFEWSILARLYEATGDQDKAIAAYRKAVAAAPTELDTQKSLVTLLDLAGRDEDAEKQLAELTRVAPGEPRFLLDLARRVLRRGDKKRGLQLLDEAARRFPNDPGVRGALADLYARWGDPAKALKEHETLARIEPDEPAHLVNLGEQYWQRGDKPRALEIWKRLAQGKTPAALARLAEVYAEHDLGADAIDAYGRALALAPKDAALYRGLAGVLERQKKLDDAIRAWEKVIALAPEDVGGRAQKREARTRILALHAHHGGIPGQLHGWARRFEGKPPDIQAGYFLAEAYLRVGRVEDAEKTLRKLLALDPQDLEALGQLVAVTRQQRKLPEAILLLKELAKKSPGREREIFAEIAELELALYHDDEAVAYAQRALEKSPNDPSAQEQLGQIYEKRERFDDAIAAYKRAIELSRRKFEVHFTLARLYLRRGKEKEAAQLYREVMRAATDEDTLRDAARRAIDLEEYLGTLGELEHELAPLAFVFSQKPIYRRVLVELWDRAVPPLATRAAAGDAAAQAELRRIGEEGLKPLLEALADPEDATQPELAVRLLGLVGNKAASAPLLRLASSPTPADRPGQRLRHGEELRRRMAALAAAGLLADARAIPSLIELARRPDKSLRAGAVWALGRIADPRAVPPLSAALADEQPLVRQLACLGLGASGDKRAIDLTIATLRGPEVPTEVKAACAHALGAARVHAAAPALAEALDAGAEDVARVAAWALGRLGGEELLPPLVAASFAGRGAVRPTAAHAIVEILAPDGQAAPPRAVELPAADALGTTAILARLAPEGAPVTPERRRTAARALVGRGRTALVAGLTDALGRHRDAVLDALEALDGADGLRLGTITAEGPAADEAALHGELAAALVALAPTVEALATHRDPEIRARALAVAAGISPTRAPTFVAAGLADVEPGVRRRALALAVQLANDPGDTGRAALAELARRLVAPGWEERLAAVEALGALAGLVPTSTLIPPLRDRSAFVREAAARALTGRADALAPLIVASRDEVPEVRAAAARALAGLPAARVRLRELGRDPDPRVRAATRRP